MIRQRYSKGIVGLQISKIQANTKTNSLVLDVLADRSPTDDPHAELVFRVYVSLKLALRTTYIALNRAEEGYLSAYEINRFWIETDSHALHLLEQIQPSVTSRTPRPKPQRPHAHVSEDDELTTLLFLAAHQLELFRTHLRT